MLQHTYLLDTRFIRLYIDCINKQNPSAPGGITYE
jgi:hypothetical protein